MSRVNGQVKWFNNKAGYGFITREEKDIFVHYSAISTADSQYKYLVQGEYVEFEIAPTTEGPHTIQAVNISGINQGKLMCETRLQSKRPPLDSSTSQEEGEEEKKEGEFTKVERKKKPAAKKPLAKKPLPTK